MKISVFVKKYQVLIAVVVVIFAVALIIDQNPNLINNINQPENQNALPGVTNVQVNLPTPAPDNLAPTSLVVVVAPVSAPKGTMVTGVVTSNGFNFPITIHAKHVGANSEVTFGGLLNSEGKFWHSQQLDLCGQWDFYVSGNGVNSNVARSTITGIMLHSEETTYSRSFDHEGVWQVFSSVSGSCSIFADDPAHGISIPLGTVIVNVGGYAVTNLDFGALTLGTYTINCVVNGQKASDFGGAVTIEVIR